MKKKILLTSVLALAAIGLTSCTVKTHDNGILIIIEGVKAINISWFALIAIILGVVLVLGLTTWGCIVAINKTNIKRLDDDLSSGKITQEQYDQEIKKYRKKTK